MEVAAEIMNAWTQVLSSSTGIEQMSIGIDLQNKTTQMLFSTTGVVRMSSDHVGGFLKPRIDGLKIMKGMFLNQEEVKQEEKAGLLEETKLPEVAQNAETSLSTTETKRKLKRRRPRMFLNQEEVKQEEKAGLLEETKLPEVAQNAETSLSTTETKRKLKRRRPITGGSRDIVLLRIFLFILVFSHVASSPTCPPGAYLHTFSDNKPGICVGCPNGTFMPNIDHQQTECRSCEKLEHPELEILVSPCSKTHDAVIHCVEGYFRDLARNPRETGTCQRCTKCSGFARYTGQPCSTYRDTVCCMDENFDVAPNHHGVPLCRERPWFCRKGHYFDTRGFQCLPCPSNTFMPEDFHVRPECIKCGDYDTFDVKRPLHSVISQPCNSTHDTVLSCPDGFYMKSTMGYRSDAMGCSPCRNCSATDAQLYERRKCDGMQDTVCCPLPNMEVQDTPYGPECVAVQSIFVDVDGDDAAVQSPYDTITDDVEAEDDRETSKSGDDGYGQNGTSAKGSTHSAVLIVFSAYLSMYVTSLC